MKAGDQLLVAALAQAKGELEVHKANIQVYQTMPAGIGEHPDIVEEMIKQIDDMAAARDGLEIIASLTTPPAEESAPPAEENN